MQQAQARLRPSTPSALVKGPDGRFHLASSRQAKLWVEGGSATTIGVTAAIQREMAYRKEAQARQVSLGKARAVAIEASKAGPQSRELVPIPREVD